jgi:hypothetical protein
VIVGLLTLRNFLIDCCFVFLVVGVVARAGGVGEGGGDVEEGIMEAGVHVCADLFNSDE